jgi:23S rRNA (pseudouridine1915-N3)-methyltransferase
MMRIKLIVIHKTEKEIYEKPVNHYINRLKTLCDFEMIEIQGLKNAHSLTETDVKNKEGQLILKSVKSQERLYLLDEHGKSYTSEQFAEFIKKSVLHGESAICFVIGGAFGFSDEMYAKAHGKINLSTFTFPHQLARLVFVEQIYRCMTIIKGHPYHHR